MPPDYDPAFEPTTAERIARNDSVFRDANERIRDAAEEHRAGPRPVPFICECADPACREILHLTLADYRWIREDAARFLTAPGHESGEGQYKVVAGGDGHRVVEKLGEAKEVAEELADGGGELATPRGEQ